MLNWFRGLFSGYKEGGIVPPLCVDCIHCKESSVFKYCIHPKVGSNSLVDGKPICTCAEARISTMGKCKEQGIYWESKYGSTN